MPASSSLGGKGVTGQSQLVGFGGREIRSLKVIASETGNLRPQAPGSPICVPALELEAPLKMRFGPGGSGS